MSPLHKMSRQSSAWNYFNKKGNDEAECLKCKKVLKSIGGSMTGLFVHLKSVYKITETDSNMKAETIKSQIALTSFLAHKSIEE